MVGLSAKWLGLIVFTRRNNRVIEVERQEEIGNKAEFENALLELEDSSTLDTSFIERLNLTLRQATPYLTRRTTCHARSQEPLENKLEMVRCCYNFPRPDRALKFGSETRTPAMQAGLASCRLTFRRILLWFASLLRNCRSGCSKKFGLIFRLRFSFGCND